MIPQDVASSNNQNAANNDQDVDVEMIDEDISVITPKVPLVAKSKLTVSFLCDIYMIN